MAPEEGNAKNTHLFMTTVIVAHLWFSSCKRVAYNWPQKPQHAYIQERERKRDASMWGPARISLVSEEWSSRLSSQMSVGRNSVFVCLFFLILGLWSKPELQVRLDSPKCSTKSCLFKTVQICTSARVVRSRTQANGGSDVLKQTTTSWSGNFQNKISNNNNNKIRQNTA